MQASLDKPYRARVTEAGQGTNAQFGPNQHMVVRWASSHNNTFSLAVVSAADQVGTILDVQTANATCVVSVSVCRRVRVHVHPDVAAASFA